jgi:hypothetical protein
MRRTYFRDFQSLLVAHTHAITSGSTTTSNMVGACVCLSEIQDTEDRATLIIGSELKCSVMFPRLPVVLFKLLQTR